MCLGRRSEARRCRNGPGLRVPVAGVARRGRRGKELRGRHRRNHGEHGSWKFPVPFGGSRTASEGNHARFERNITAFSTGPAAIFSNAEDLQASCNVFWGNEENFFGYVPAPTDRLIDPLLCNWEAGDVHLSSLSPCLPANSGGCGLIGARGEGCGTPCPWRTAAGHGSSHGTGESDCLRRRLR